MRFNNTHKDKTFEINITPLIDVVFLLLIFFMVSTTFIFSNSIEVDLPQAKGDEVSVSDNIRVTINKQGGIAVNGLTHPDTSVPDVLRDLKQRMPQGTVIIEADSGVNHGKVVFVMDASRKAGFDKFAIAVEEE